MVETWGHTGLVNTELFTWQILRLLHYFLDPSKCPEFTLRANKKVFRAAEKSQHFYLELKNHRKFPNILRSPHSFAVFTFVGSLIRLADFSEKRFQSKIFTFFPFWAIKTSRYLGKNDCRSCQIDQPFFSKDKKRVSLVSKNTFQDLILFICISLALVNLSPETLKSKHF